MLLTVQHILTDVIKSVYQPFFFAVTQTVLFMFFYQYCFHPENAGKGIKKAIYGWLASFRNSKQFRCLFFLVFYVVLILFRTLYSREMWVNPLQNVIGVWTLHKTDVSGNYVYTTEVLENLALFIPFGLLLIANWAIRKKRIIGIGEAIKISSVYTFAFSFGIEILQLFLRVGTFQLSDLVYNTVGGVSGGITYYFFQNLYKNKKMR